MLSWQIEPARLDVLTKCKFPWKRCEHSGEYLIHVSSAILVMQHKWFDGFADQVTRNFVTKYIREAQKTFTQDKIKPPEKFDWGTLFTEEWHKRGYQCAGMQRIYTRLTRFTSGMLLGDDVGLGKTAQAIGVLGRMRREGYFGIYPGIPASQRNNNGHVVIFTTTSCRSQWGDEIERFSAVKFRVVVVQGSAVERRERMARDADIYILNHEMVRLPQYQEQVEQLMAGARVALMDETYKLKNPDAIVTRRMRDLTRGVSKRIAFNATPIENGLHDLYSIFDILDPGVIGLRDGFEGRYVKRDERGKVVGYDHVKEFKIRAGILYLRRTAKECGEHLPPVRASYRPVAMGKKQEAAYRAAAGTYVRDASKGAVAFSKLAAVQYAALAADITDLNSESAKLDDLESLLDGELTGERLVVFSRFKVIARFVYRRLARFRPMIIDGDTSTGNRDLARRRFESVHGVGRILICTEAGDSGLNLQAAGVVVNLDLPWNPARFRQRFGRVWRIGQTRSSVLVINPIARFAERPEMRTVDDWFVNEMLEGGKKLINEKMFGKDGVDALGRDTIDFDAVRKYVQDGMG